MNRPGQEIEAALDASLPSPPHPAAPRTGALALALAVFATSAAALQPRAAPTRDGGLPEAKAPPSGAQASRERPAPHAIFAAEDTLEVPASFRMTPIEVRASRLGIGEIVRRCIKREEELREKILTHEYTLVTKTVFSIGGADEGARRRMVIEQVDRVLFTRSTGERVQRLKLDQYEIVGGQRREWTAGDDPVVRISYADLNSLPFYLEEKDDYDFSILSREIVGRHVIYRVRLTPRSDFAIAPRGILWIDTTNFQILREEFDFGERVPMPMFVKSLGPLVRERERIGNLWVWKRMLARVDLRMGYLRFLDRNLPDTAEIQLLFRDHRVNGRTMGEGLIEPVKRDPPPEGALPPAPGDRR